MRWCRVSLVLLVEDVGEGEDSGHGRGEWGSSNGSGKEEGEDRPRDRGHCYEVQNLYNSVGGRCRWEMVDVLKMY